MPKRIQLRRVKNWRMPRNTISVARPGAWGNHYRVGDIDHKTGELISDRAHAVRLFKERCIDGMLPEDFRPLRGLNLACWCPLPKPGEPDICHAAMLLEIASEGK